MTTETKVRIFKSSHNFSAAHFLVDMGKCERLHGHNYYVTVELGGEPGPDDTIIDFQKINPVIKSLCDTLDHKVLIAKNDERSQVINVDGQIEVKFAKKRYSFPEADCLIVPVATTTVEKLAQYLADKIVENMVGALPNIKWIEVGVGESTGQMALYRRPAR